MEHVLFFHTLGISQLTNIFQRGWNHQPDNQVWADESWGDCWDCFFESTRTPTSSGYVNQDCSCQGEVRCSAWECSFSFKLCIYIYSIYILYYFILYYVILYYIIINYSALYYIILHYIISSHVLYYISCIIYYIFYFLYYI